MPLTNTELKALKLLKAESKRDRQHFLAEGVRVLEESVRHRVAADQILVCESRLGDRGKTLAGRMAKLGGIVTDVPARQFDAISDAETSQGLAGVFTCPKWVGRQPDLSNVRRILICDGISDPGNLGTLFRSALAFGFSVVMVTGESADSFSPKTVRSSAGAVFGLTIVQEETTQVVRQLAEREVLLLVADGSGAALSAVKLKQKRGGVVGLVIGSEARGVSAPLKKAADAVVRIDHEASVESLNAAVAGSILMKEIYSQ